MGYGQPLIIEAGGARQLIVWHTAALVSLNPETGAVYWEEPWETGSGMSVATPVQSDDYLMVDAVLRRVDDDAAQSGPAGGVASCGKGSSRSEMPDETDGLHLAHHDLP